MKKYRWLLVLGVFALVLFVPILVQADVGNSFSGGSSGGDYGGGSENLICTNTGTVGGSSTLSPHEMRGGDNGCRISRTLTA